jgi:hypothetical protein
MSIRATTGPGASPPPGLNNSSNNQNHPQQISTGAPGVRIIHGCARPWPRGSLVSFMAIPSIQRGGDQW